MRIEKDPLLHALNVIQTEVERALLAQADYRSARVLLAHGAPHETSIVFCTESMDERRQYQVKVTVTHDEVGDELMLISQRVPVIWFDDFENRPTMERLNTTSLFADVPAMQPQLEAIVQRVLEVITRT